MSATFRNLIRIGLIAGGAWLSVVGGAAATYYVDYSAGHNANTGTTTNAPWKHCPGDTNATGNANTSLSPGDMVRFKGGVRYLLNPPRTEGQYFAVYGSPAIRLKWDGTAEHPITYDGNSDGTWGTGRAILTDHHSSNHVVAFFKEGNGSNLVFNSFDIGPIGGQDPLPPDPGSAVPARYGSGIAFAGNAAAAINVTIANCYFHELGYWQNTKPIGWSSLGGSGIRFTDGSNVIITNCEFTKVYQPISALIRSRLLGVEIVKCNFHNYIQWCVDIAYIGNGSVADNIAVHDCTFTDTDRDYGAVAGGPWTGYGDPPHQDGIYFRDSLATDLVISTNVCFYNNTFTSTFNWAGGTSLIYLDGTVCAYVFNNVFVNCAVNNGAVEYDYSSCGTPPHFGYRKLGMYNNTFRMYIRPALAFGGVCLADGKNSLFFPPSDHVEIDFRNNIFVQTITNSGNGWLILMNSTNKWNSGIYSPTNNFHGDYNLYLTKNNNGWPGKPPPALWQAGYHYFTPAKMRSLLGWEHHGLFADPRFVSATDLHLQTNSPAINAGENLTHLGIPALLKDRDGKARPASGPWTIGAYEGARP